MGIIISRSQYNVCSDLFTNNVILFDRLPVESRLLSFAKQVLTVSDGRLSGKRELRWSVDHALVVVLLELLKVVVVFLLEFLGDGNSLLNETRDMVQHDKIF